MRTSTTIWTTLAALTLLTLATLAVANDFGEFDYDAEFDGDKDIDGRDFLALQRTGWMEYGTLRKFNEHFGDTNQLHEDGRRHYHPGGNWVPDFWEPDVTATPEPSGLLLSVIGLLLLFVAVNRLARRKWRHTTHYQVIGRNTEGRECELDLDENGAFVHPPEVMEYKLVVTGVNEKTRSD